MKAFFERIAEVQRLLEAGPNERKVGHLLTLLEDKEIEAFAFGHLDTAEWLPALRRTPVFNSVPRPEEHRERGLISFPIWAPSQYLARVASQAPAEVFGVIRELPLVTNPSVIADLLDALIQIPAPLGVELLDIVLSWVEGQFGLARLTPGRFARLSMAWAADGREYQAIRLADTLLRRYIPGSTNAYSSSELDRLVRTFTDSKSPLDSKPLLVLLGELLSLAIENALMDKTSRSDDLSHIWRPRLSATGSVLHGARDVFTSAVIEVATRIAASNSSQVVKLIEQLEGFRWPIFQRIGLHILRLNAKNAPELVVFKLRDPGHHDSSNLWPEYSTLLAAEFSRLSENDQRRILEWILSQDYTAEATRWFTEWRKEEATPERIAEFHTVRRLNKLLPLKGQLPDWWRKESGENAELARRLEEFSESPRPQFVSGFAETPRNPLAEESLCEKSDDEIIDFLRAASDEGDEASVSARASALSSALGKCHDRIAGLAARVSTLTVPAQILYSYFFHLGTTARNRERVPWGPVLDLGRSATMRDLAGSPASVEEAKRQLLELVQAGLRSDAGAAMIPLELASVVWSVIEPLTNDPDPAGYEATTDELPTLIFRGARTLALRAAVEYGLWRFRGVYAEALKPGRSFNLIPELKAVLDHHADPVRDSAEPVRAAFGQLFPYLFWLDADWATSSVEKIFSIERAEAPAKNSGKIAWASYLFHNQPADTAYDLLKGYYARAVDALHPAAKNESPRHDPEESLSEHLMVLFWRGKISLSREDLIARFFDRANPKLRAHALAFVGTSSRDTEGDIPPEIRERLEKLWDWRLERAQSQPNENKADLAAFGWWFASGKFGEEESLDRFEKTLAAGAKPEPAFLLEPRLLELASTHPQRVARVLRLAIQNTDDRWEFSGGEATPHEILERVLKSTDIEALKEARQTIDALGSAGFLELRDLWEQVEMKPKLQSANAQLRATIESQLKARQDLADKVKKQTTKTTGADALRGKQPRRPPRKK